MSNAAKYKKKAADFESQRLFDKAIASYKRAIEVADSDKEEIEVSLFNKVGDLTLRMGRVADAVTYYERAVEHYTASGLFNNAIALCNKILRHAPGRTGVYLMLGRVCANKGLRGDATRNFLEYASRMQREGRTEEAMGSLAEVLRLMPELDEVRRLVEEHAARAGITLPANPVDQEEISAGTADSKHGLVFLDVDYDTELVLPVGEPEIIVSVPIAPVMTSQLEDLLIFDPSEPDDLPEIHETLEGIEFHSVENGDLENLVEGKEDSEVHGVEAESEDVKFLVFDSIPDIDLDEIEMVESQTPEDLALVVEDQDPSLDAASSVAERLDPHDFILPGELPPIVLSARSISEFDEEDSGPSLDIISLESIESIDSKLEVREVASDEELVLTPVDSAPAMDEAEHKCEAIRLELIGNPSDWGLRRRLAEALLEAGDYEAGLSELSATILSLEVEGNLAEAARVADGLVRVAPDDLSGHQKRVELAVRLGDRERLRESYLDLADTLVRKGLGSRAGPVYVRVLELDPWDDRARAALGDSAPPLPVKHPVEQENDGYVSLAEWLADDSGDGEARMRLREPTVTGDEAADFDLLLEQFREGVSRTLGEDDYESHYDLGVAYKEMGLMDDAIAEFQKALRSSSHRIAAYEALGQCFIEQGNHPVAVTVLSRAMHEPGLDDFSRVGVLYLLGYACEAMQRNGEARSYYERVYTTDSQFRDVEDRLGALNGAIS